MIPTAEEFLKLRILSKGQWIEDDKVMGGTTSGIENVQREINLRVPQLIEFAKLHVTEALKQASERVEINDFDEHEQYSPCVDEKSILNAYPLENIK